MRPLIPALVLLVAGSGALQAKCADDVKELRARVEHRQKVRPTPQGLAALKELEQADADLKHLAELDCYNSVSRARKALRAPPPAEEK